MLHIKDLSYQINSAQWLRIEELRIKPHHLTALLGINGTGKSTLFRLIAGLLKHRSGSIKYNDCALKDYPFRSRNLAMVSQFEAINTTIKVYDYILLGRLAYNNSYQREDYSIVDYIIDGFSITPLLDKLYHQLSGGERQRISLARALAQLYKNSEFSGILLLDEFNVHLDLAAQRQILLLLKQLAKRNPLIIFSISHDLNQVLEFYDETILMHNGKILDYGITSTVLNPDNLHTVYGLKMEILKIRDRIIALS